MDADEDAHARDAAESCDIDIASVLLEAMNMRPLNALKERHPSKFNAEICFGDATLSIRQTPGAATGLRASNGGTVWNCAKALTRYLEACGAAEFRARRVVEVGAGVGLCGIAAATLGARVTLTDKRGMVDLLRDNIDANARAIAAAGGEAAADAMAWGQPMHSLYRVDSLDGACTVLASDTVYHRADGENLLYTMARLCGMDASCRAVLDAPLPNAADEGADANLDALPVWNGGSSMCESPLGLGTAILSYKLRDDYPCGGVFVKAARLFALYAVARDEWCDDAAWSTQHVIRMVPLPAHEVERRAAETAAALAAMHA
jgi:hypothetical protein